MSREVKQTGQAVAEKPDRAKLAQTGKRIDEIRQTYEAALAAAGNDYERGCVLACAMIDLRAAVKDYLPVLRQLQGSKLGFLTDRDPGKDFKNAGPYPEQVVVDCAIEAVMRGARWTGNEFNILAGGCYLTKEFWWRKVTEIDELTDLDIVPGIPEFVNQKCVVGMVATWKLRGKPQSITRKFSILVRNNQTDDATIGKAEGRLLKAIYRKLTGTETSDADDDTTAEPAVKVPPQPAITAPPPLAEGEVPNDGAEPFDWTAGQDAAGERAKLDATK